MGLLYKSGKIRSYIFIFLVFLSVLICVPVQKKVAQRVSVNTGLIMSIINEKTGLTISYSSLSPSILSNIYIRDIKVYDIDDDLLFEVKKCRITFNIFKLIKGDIQEGISSVLVDGINLDVDETKRTVSEIQKTVEKQQISIKAILNKVPGNFKIKNVVLIYDEKKNYVSGNFKNVVISNNPMTDVLDFSLDAVIDCSLSVFPQSRFSGKMKASGIISQNLEYMQTNIKISDFTDGQYKLNKLSLYSAYKDGVIDLHTIQSVNPLSIAADYRLSTGDINVQLITENLSLFSLFSNNIKSKEFQKFKNLTLTTDTILKCNLKNEQIDYISDASIKIPDNLINGGVDAVISLYGDKEKVQLSKLELTGPMCNANARLNLVFDKVQLSGFVDITNYVLKNGSTISTEVYIDPKESGFMAFSPQLFIGEKPFTALEFNLIPGTDSYDFSFEGYDYTHIEENDPGKIAVDGSYLVDSNYLQTSISISSLYADSMAELASQFTNQKLKNLLDSVKSNLSPYMLSGDVYTSFDFKSFSYNIPYVLFANTQKDNQVLMFSVNGNEQSAQLNQFSLVYGKFACEATASVDKNPDSSEYFFTADLNADSVPYHFTGSLLPERISLSGDYGTEIEVSFNDNGKIKGEMLLENLPLSYNNTTIILSSDANFEYDKPNGPQIQLQRLEAEIANGKGNVSVNPKVVMAGSMTKYGAQINSIAFTDIYSTMEGSADLMLNINEGIFDSVGIMMNIKNPLSEEAVILDGSISNPDHKNVTIDNLLKYTYINLQLQLNSFGLNRLGLQQNNDNILTATLFASGTVEHPYVSLNIDEASVLLTSEFLKLNGSVVLEDRDVSINDMNVNFGSINVNHIIANASITDMTMDASGELDLSILGKSLQAPLSLSVTNSTVPYGKILPDSFMATLSSDGVAGTFMKKVFPFSISTMYSDKVFNIFSSDNINFSGLYSQDGFVELTLNNKNFMTAKLDGFLTKNVASLELYDFFVDLYKVGTYINLDELVLIDSGKFTGNVFLTGSIADPDINGSAAINSASLRIPSVSDSKFTSEVMNFNIVHNEISLEKALVATKDGGKAELDFKFFLNKFILQHIEGTVQTVKKDTLPLYVVSQLFSFKGNVSADLSLFYEDKTLEVKGKVAGENVVLTSSVSSMSNIGKKNKKKVTTEDLPVTIITDLDVTLGNHSSINFDPLLRCVFVPNTTIKVQVDQSNDTYMIDGALKLRSGDIAYLNRSFYIKSGSIKFNPDDITNPIVTVSAETREKDEKGQTVKIIFSVDKQYLLTMEPKFTSEPAKSENEIRTLLGQIVVADSRNASSFLFAASDYAIQSTVVRNAENKLRDLFNFDIFSVRTNVLQNTLNLGVSGNLSKENITIGNFLDNSTVYIGKYLGSALYLDAMLHVSFKDGNTKDITSAGSLIFQPEFGMELESPFANIRMNMAPDINALLNNQFVPSASVTLSWKVTF